MMTAPVPTITTTPPNMAHPAGPAPARAVPVDFIITGAITADLMIGGAILAIDFKTVEEGD